MQFGIGKCALLGMKNGNQHLSDGMKLPNQDKSRRSDKKETYKYLGVLEADTIKQVEMKEQIKTEYLRNKYLGCTLVRFSGLFL